MAAPSQRTALGVLFLLLSAMFAGIAVAAVESIDRQRAAGGTFYEEE